jgi:hypothetical protein
LTTGVLNRRPTTPGPRTGKRYAVVLAVLALAFAGRVLGQVLVALFQPPYLPPMSEWYSGLLPYPFLLPTQCVILWLQYMISRQLWAGRGRLAVQRPALGSFLKWFSLAYALAMAVRYGATMWLLPERRWLGGVIPILFHEVLAAYLYVLSRYHRMASRRTAS